MVGTVSAKSAHELMSCIKNVNTAPNRVGFYLSYIWTIFSALHFIKVTGDSLLLHEFAYSLFIGLCSVTSNMTGYSHSYDSIKLIHCGTPQRNVLSDKMVL